MRNVVAIAGLIDITSTDEYINSLEQRKRALLSSVNLSVQGWDKHKSVIRPKATDQSTTWKPDSRHS